MTKEIKTIHLSTVVENHTQDLTNRVAAVTGTTSGTGYVCARELAKLGASVLLLNRASERSDASLSKVRTEAPQGIFESITCNLQDFESVRKATGQIKSLHDTLDILCNNAGVMSLKDIATGDGYDIQVQTNCLSHFLLTKDLFPLLKRSTDARIVNHSSMARLGGPLHARYFAKKGGDLGGDGTDKESQSFAGPRWERYHQTKLGNAAFTYGLMERLKKHSISNVKSLLAHPGFAMTSLQASTAQTGGIDINSPMMAKAQSAEDGALGILRACADPKAATGDFYGPVELTGFPEVLSPEDLLRDTHNTETYWKGCEAAVGIFEF